MLALAMFGHAELFPYAMLLHARFHAAFLHPVELGSRISR